MGITFSGASELLQKDSVNRIRPRLTHCLGLRRHNAMTKHTSGVTSSQLPGVCVDHDTTTQFVILDYLYVQTISLRAAF